MLYDSNSCNSNEHQHIRVLENSSLRTLLIFNRSEIRIHRPLSTECVEIFSTCRTLRVARQLWTYCVERIRFSLKKRKKKKNMEKKKEKKIEMKQNIEDVSHANWVLNVFSVFPFIFLSIFCFILFFLKTVFILNRFVAVKICYSLCQSSTSLRMILIFIPNTS